MHMLRGKGELLSFPFPPFCITCSPRPPRTFSFNASSSGDSGTTFMNANLAEATVLGKPSST